jgi:hypothetical protein
MEQTGIGAATFDTSQRGSVIREYAFSKILISRKIFLYDDIA